MREQLTQSEWDSLPSYQKHDFDSPAETSKMVFAYIPSGDYGLLQAYAKNMGVNVSDVVRMIIAEWIEEGNTP